MPHSFPRPAFRRIAFRLCCTPALSLSMLLMTGMPVQAQVSSGAITGKVTDQSGAVVVGASVQVINVRTGVKLNAKTNEVGDYSFRNLLPGTYNLSLSQPGFRTYEENNIPVVVSETTSHDVTLSVGEPASRVTVEASLAAIDTNSATLGQVIQEREVRDLPLNGRNFTQLLTLSPGVAAPSKVSGSWGNPQIGQFTTPSINGQSTKSTMFLLDGSNNSSPSFALISVSPIIDDIAEFKLQSHPDSAEYGGVLGGVVNLVTKAGTNQFHGGVWEFLRNDKLDARNFFRAGVTPLRQNTFGGNIGGPVILPHYNGRNRTFLFGSYQGYRESAASAGLYRVPTPRQLSGDLTGEQPFFDPFSTRPDPANPGQFVRDPFANNQIPADRLDPVSIGLAKAIYPAPVETGFAGTNGRDTRPQITNQDLFTVRGDQQFRADSISVRFTKFRTPVATTGGIIGSTFARKAHGFNFGTNVTHTFSSSTIFHALFARSWVDLNLSTKWDNIDHDALVPKLFAPDFGCGYIGGFGSKKCYIPAAFITGYAGVGEFDGRVGQTDIWEFKPDISTIRGAHTFKAGFSLATHNLWATTQRAVANFDSFQTADLRNPGKTGSALASFLLGVPAGAERADAPNSQQPAWLYGFFLQDQWKVGTKLTLNLGFRWDANILPRFGEASEGNNYSGSMDLLRGVFLIPADPGPCDTRGKPPCIPGGKLPEHVVIAKDGKIFQNIYDNFQPRLGLAYRITGKTVFRAGVGRFFDSWNETTLAVAQSEGLWPDKRRITDSLLNRTTVTARFSNPLALAGKFPDPTPFGLTATWRDPQLKNPRSDQWNAGIEHQLSSSTVVGANYVGSRGHRIPIGGEYNTAYTPGPGDPKLRTLYPYISAAPFIRDWGRSWYDSLQVSFSRIYSRGLSYSLAYTWSKTQDVSASDGFAGGPQDPYHLNNDKSVADFNLPHVLTGNIVYELPFGKMNNRLIRQALGYWQFNGIAQFTSGTPYRVFVCGDIANIGRGGCYMRPNLVGNATVSDRSPARWLNNDAFAAPLSFTFGNLGRNPFRGDGYSNLDLSVFRDFRIREQTKLQFRLESFNALNHTVFGNPNGNLSDSNFGRIFGTRSIERQLQIGAKLYF